jgi:uncharacterized membrane protein YkgB
VEAATLAYIAAGLCAVWGIAHIAATKPVVGGFGPLTIENERILTMTWVGGGLTLVFIGVLVFLFTLPYFGAGATAWLVYQACAGMLIVSAVLMLSTASRTPVVAMKLCPLIQSASAVLLILASL